MSAEPAHNFSGSPRQRGTVDAFDSSGMREPAVGSSSDILRNLKLAVAWAGLPPYGLNNIRALVAHFGVMPIVIGTKPDVSYEAIQKVSGMPIHWINPSDSITWNRLGERIPDVFVVSGWATRPFNDLGREVRGNGGSVIAMVDNRWRGDLRQWLAPIIFNTRYRNWFKAAIVPGKSARRFVRHLGIPDDAIYDGLYGGNPDVFSPGLPLHERPKHFLFVGRFDDRKGLADLAAAWQIVKPQLPEWELHAVGEGRLRSTLESLPSVVIHPFKQLNDIADVYRDSRFLILPSLEDHWGVVVHEAARSGCGLLLSKNVGARDDLANAVNSFVFPARNPVALANAILRAAQLSEAQLRSVYHESLALSYRFGPRLFAHAVVDAVVRIATTPRNVNRKSSGEAYGSVNANAERPG